PAEAHFGVGDLAVVGSIEVRWADGSVEHFPGPETNQVIELVRGTGAPGPP
ncbi:MAG: ASPIC/UnbV domain-containing protein, partial [Planctomycetota bacterium]